MSIHSQSLIHPGRTEEFVIDAEASDISLGGVGLRLSNLSDFINLYQDQPVHVSLWCDHQEESLSARVAHFEDGRGRLGLEFDAPLVSLELQGI